jgi:hypothetical protein
MNRLIYALLLIAACVAFLGWYRGWFTVDVDKNKIQADEQRAKEKLKEAKEKLTQEAK